MYKERKKNTRVIKRVKTDEIIWDKKKNGIIYKSNIKLENQSKTAECIN